MIKLILLIDIGQSDIRAYAVAVLRVFKPDKSEQLGKGMYRNKQ